MGNNMIDEIKKEARKRGLEVIECKFHLNGEDAFIIPQDNGEAILSKSQIIKEYKAGRLF